MCRAPSPVKFLLSNFLIKFINLAKYYCLPTYFSEKSEPLKTPGPGETSNIASSQAGPDYSSVQCGKVPSEPFETKRGLRRRNSVSSNFSNLPILIAAGTMQLVYTDDIDIVGLKTRIVSTAFFGGLAVNIKQDNYLLATNKGYSLIWTHVTWQ